MRWYDKLANQSVSISNQIVAAFSFFRVSVGLQLGSWITRPFLPVGLYVAFFGVAFRFLLQSVVSRFAVCFTQSLQLSVITVNDLISAYYRVSQKVNLYIPTNQYITFYSIKHTEDTQR